MEGILVPVIIHFCIFNILNMMRLHADAASLTTMAAVISLPVFLFMYKKDREARGETGWGLSGLKARDILLIGAAAISANLFFTLIMEGARRLFHLSNATQEALFEGSYGILIIGVAIICPVMEEVLFRGLVYRRLKAYNEGWFAVLIAAAFFAVYHGNAIQILFAFPMAIIIIGFYEKYGTILAPILFHIIVNLSSVILDRGF